MTDERFHKGARIVNISGLEFIFKVLCLICRIMIYRLPVRDSIDSQNVDKFRKELKELEE